jgi:DNA-binding MurR/RpiR family transcriptional regulator
MCTREKTETIEKIWKYIDDMGERYKCVLECMVNSINQHGLIVLSIRSISREVGMPSSSVHRTVRRLQDEGFVERVDKVQQGCGSVYRLCC